MPAGRVARPSAMRTAPGGRVRAPSSPAWPPDGTFSALAGSLPTMRVAAAYHGRRRRGIAVHGTGVVGVETLRTLVERARSAAVPPERRADAFGEIVRRYQDLVYGYAYSLLGDRDLAQDAAQEAFLAAYRALPQLDDLEAIGPLLDTGARVNARDGAGRTALGWAIEAGQHEAAELLRRRGARL
jgi:hypothetical protein